MEGDEAICVLYTVKCLPVAVTVPIHYLSYHQGEIPARSNSGEEMSIWAWHFRGFGSWLLGSMCLGRTSWQWECVTEKCVTWDSPPPCPGSRDYIRKGGRRPKELLTVTPFQSGSPRVSITSPNSTTSQVQTLDMRAVWGKGKARHIQTITTELEPHGDLGKTWYNWKCIQIPSFPWRQGLWGWQHYVHIPMQCWM